MTREWSHLPNAKHIDWVIKTLKENLEVWSAAGRYVAGRYAGRKVARSAARRDALDAALGVARAAAWDAAMDAAGGAARDDVWDVARGAAWDAAWGAITALIAWDESIELLDKSVKEVKELVKEGNHAAILLLPAVIVKNKLKELEND